MPVKERVIAVLLSDAELADLQATSTLDPGFDLAKLEEPWVRFTRKERDMLCRSIKFAMAHGVVVGSVLAWLAAPVGALPIDLSVTDIFGIRTIGSGEGDPPEDNLRIPGFAPPIMGGSVGFTFFTQAQNVGTDHIPWGWPVREATPPFSGKSEGIQHKHDKGLPIALSTNHSFFGPHPHIGLFLFKQPADGDPLILIGHSDLKHTFSTGGCDFKTRVVEPHPHYLLPARTPATGVAAPPGSGCLPQIAGVAQPGETDIYSSFANEDQNFFGPWSEIDSSFHVLNHWHLGGKNPGAARDDVVGGAGIHPFNVYDRRHPTGPDGFANEADRFVHLLTAPVAQLRDDLEPLAKWFAAASYYVVDDGNLANNTFYKEFRPHAGGGGTTFDPEFVGGDGRNLGTGTHSVKGQGFIPPIPEPSSLLLLGIGLASLAAWHADWRMRSFRRSPGAMR